MLFNEHLDVQPIVQHYVAALFYRFFCEDLLEMRLEHWAVF